MKYLIIGGLVIGGFIVLEQRIEDLEEAVTKMAKANYDHAKVTEMLCKIAEGTTEIQQDTLEQLESLRG